MLKIKKSYLAQIAGSYAYIEAVVTFGFFFEPG